MTHATETIRKLNDDFRRSLTGGSVMMTPGIAALGPNAVARLIEKLIAYDDFTEGSDPHHEHDFGAIEIDGERTFFKLDYYSLDLQAHSPNPADPTVTQRVMTIMLASEF
jgi:Protein of unknown function (DUF3768)